MEFKELYRGFVVSNGIAGTMEAVGRQFIAEYLQSNGSAGERFTNSYKKLDDMFRECGSERNMKNFECFAWMNDLLRTEAGRNKK